MKFSPQQCYSDGDWVGLGRALNDSFNYGLNLNEASPDGVSPGVKAGGFICLLMEY
jgi:hypothetical protein